MPFWSFYFFLFKILNDPFLFLSNRPLCYFFSSSAFKTFHLDLWPRKNLIKFLFAHRQRKSLQIIIFFAEDLFKANELPISRFLQLIFFRVSTIVSKPDVELIILKKIILFCHNCNNEKWKNLFCFLMIRYGMKK